MRPYSLDLRTKITEACDQHDVSQAHLAQTFGVRLSFVEKLLHRRRRTGSLAPAPRPGDVWCLDNLKPTTCGASRRPWPRARPGSSLCPRIRPDFSPIGECWLKVKTILRGIGARTREALEAAVEWALAQVTPADARGWYQSCGYAVLPP